MTVVSAYSKLRRRQQIFVDAYIEHGVGTEAFLAVNPASTRPEIGGSKMLAHPKVKQAIHERVEAALTKAGVREVRVLKEIAALAFASVAQLRAPDGTLLPFKDLPESLLTGAVSIELNEKGAVSKLRLAKVDGLAMLGKYLKLFVELHEHTGKDGGPIQTEELSDTEKARRIAFLLTQGLRQSADEEQVPISLIPAIG